MRFFIAFKEKECYNTLAMVYCKYRNQRIEGYDETAKKYVIIYKEGNTNHGTI